MKVNLSKHDLAQVRKENACINDCLMKANHMRAVGRDQMADWYMSQIDLSTKVISGIIADSKNKDCKGVHING